MDSFCIVSDIWCISDSYIGDAQCAMADGLDDSLARSSSDSCLYFIDLCLESCCELWTVKGEVLENEHRDVEGCC